LYIYLLIYLFKYTLVDSSRWTLHRFQRVFEDSVWGTFLAFLFLR